MNHLLRRVTLISPILLMCAILYSLPATAQESQPTSTYFYYGQQVDLDQMGQIASHRYQEIGRDIDCVYVPASADNSTSPDYHQVFECFDTPNEARRFNQQMRSSDTRYADTLAEAPYNAQTQTSCPYWAVYSQSFHIASSWAGSICAGQAVYVSAGIWSLWNSASNDIRLSDNPNYPGLRWTFGWTQYALPAGPGGARQAYHCTNTIC